MKTFLLVVAGMWVAAGAAGSELTDRIRREAQACADALVSGDYATVAALTHARIVSEMGGAVAAAAAIGEAMVEMKAQGIAIESAVIGAPGEPLAEDALVAVLVPQTITLKTPKGRLRQEGHLLAISENGGTTWAFIEAGSLDDGAIAAYFPALAGKLKLPEKAEPVLIAE